MLFSSNFHALVLFSSSIMMYHKFLFLDLNVPTAAALCNGRRVFICNFEIESLTIAAAWGSDFRDQ